MSAVAPRSAPVVAVIDDSEDHRALTRRMLEPAYQVRTYADGAGALADFAAGAVPDLVLLDIRMPWLSGREVLARLRGDAYLAARFAGIPIIVYSAAAGAADLTAYRAAGFDGWIGKPVDQPAEFRARVAAYLVRSPATSATPSAASEAVAATEPEGPASEAPDASERAQARHDLLSALGAVQASLRLLRRQLPALCEREHELVDIADRNAARALGVVRTLFEE